MPLAAGIRLGPYEVVAPLGAGGMGEVYRARDPRLSRDVAIKALPAEFARDAERLARFEREAKLLASLSHPNVAGIHGVEDEGGTRYLVLEFVDGETLEAALKRAPMPLAEVLDVARQIAAGVEAAHEAGVVHRDLKPGNVMLTASGGVKVLDFGLARGGAGRSASGSDPQLSASPTMTYAATQAGVILGTAAYMSPEQARGKVVDRRTDIWSFGCVLYEMLAGRRAYDGETVSDMVARILEREPDWSALPAATPPRLVALLKRCLTKDAKQRQRDLGDVRLELEAIAAGETGVAMTTGAGVAPSRWSPLPWAVAALALVVAGVATFVTLRAGGSHREAVTLTLLSPTGVVMGVEPADLAVSPDGRSVVFAATDTLTGRRLWLRSLERENTRPLVGTEGAEMPFWSPDSRRIGFFAHDKLQTLDLPTGAIRTLASAPLPRGGAWGKDVILYQPLSLGPLWSVPVQGGTPAIATVVDSAHGEQGHRFPLFLADGRHFVLMVIRAGLNRVAAGALGQRELHELFETSGSAGAMLASREWLIAPREGRLQAQRLDVGALKMTGPTVEVPGLRIVSPSANGAPVLSASANGVLAQRATADLPQRFSLVDRQGRALLDLAPPDGIFGRGSLAPDQHRAVLEHVLTGGVTSFLWVVDLVRGDAQPFLTMPDAYTPAFSPDGRTIAFTHDAPGTRQDLWFVDVDSPGSVRLGRRMKGFFQTALGWSPDGRGVLLRTQGTTTRQDLIYAPVDSTQPIRSIRVTEANEPTGMISPDGRWLAYVTDESGRQEVRVTSFADPNGPSTVVSRGAYADPTSNSRIGLPVWRRDGRELLYFAADGRTLMVVPVTPGANPTFGEPRPLFRLANAVADIVVGPDLDRFLLSITRDEEGRSTATVILDWMGLLDAAK